MTIRIGASEIGGTFYTQALALKKCFASVPSLPNVEVVKSHLGASIENAHRLESGDLDFAFISAPWVAAAKRGTTPFSRSLDLKTVAPMNIGPNFFIVRADSPLTKVADLRGRKLAIGLRTSGMTPHADAVLNALRMGPHDLERVYVDFAEGAEMLVAGDVDAQYQRPIPNRVMTDLCQRVPLRILRMLKALNSCLTFSPRRTHAARSLRTRFVASFTHSPVVTATSCERLRRRSRSKTGHSRASRKAYQDQREGRRPCLLCRVSEQAKSIAPSVSLLRALLLAAITPPAVRSRPSP